MTRIKYLLLTAICLVCAQAYGQSLLVYHVVGQVSYRVNGVSKPLVMNTKVTAQTSITVPYGGKVELLNEQSKQRVTIKQPGQGTIKQLPPARGNSVSQLSGKYIAYVKKQLGNKNLVSQKRYTDFVTVTRELDSVEVAAPKQELSFADRFNQFKKQSEQKYLSFRQECNKQYTDFVRQAWERFGAEPPVKRPEEPKVEPVVYQDTLATSKFLFFGRKKKKANVKGDEATARAPQRPEPVEPIERVALSEEETEYGTMPFVFFGNELSVHLDETKRFNIGEINPNRIADILLYLSGSTYDNLVCDCLALRDNHQLCDWAYLLMLKGITDQFCGADTNESALLLGYLYYQSGYKIRFASDDNDHLYLLVASNDVIYDKSSYVINGEKFYPVHDVDVALNICTAKFPKESNLSLRIDKAIEFDKMATEVRTITSERFPDLHINVAVNKNLIDFYNEYPSSYNNNDIYTFWAIYADTPMNEDVKTQIYPVLREYIKGKSEAEAVGSLLNLVQTGLEYKLDKEVWGVEDRAFFAEETLFYPYCDCEDRAILLTRLVRDLLGLECVLIYYPGHMACAVHCSEPVDGDYYTYGGKDFTVCDPTYIGAPIGRQMPDFADKEATLIPIKTK